MSESKTTFGEVLIRLRSAAALSQEELSRRSGLSRSGISHLERGLHPAPRLETVRMLADALALDEGDRSTLLAAARSDLFSSQRSRPLRSPWPAVPTPMTRIIGREAERAALSALIQHNHVRFLTITGPGGVGKTRLAVALARALADIFPDGVIFVDLSPLSDASLVIPAIATAIGVPEGGGRPLSDKLSAVLAAKTLLLLLDNGERLLAAAPDLVALLAGAPGLTILTTSREAWRVRGEHAFPLRPLPLPAAHLPPLADLAQIPSVALFLERAAEVQPGFALTADNASAVAGICQRLDGLPLAIELAAARVAVLPPAALLARLERQLPLLAGGPRDVPARLRTMREAIAWSTELLPPAEAWLFHRLAVFVGGFTLEAAAGVADGAARGSERGTTDVPVPIGDTTPDTSDILDLLIGLIDKSLVQATLAPTPEPRFTMLEPVREFALEQLTARGEAEEAADAHAAYFLALAAREAPDPTRQRDIAARLERFDAEQANFRQAIGYFANRDPDAAQRLAGQLAWFWYLRGHLSAGRGCLEQALAAGTAVSPRVRSVAFAGLGQMVLFQGEFVIAEEAFATALALAQDARDLSAMAYTEQGQAVLALYRADSATAGQLALQSAAHFEEAGDLPHAVSGRFVAARALLIAGDLDAADARFRAILADFRGLPYLEGMVGAHLGDIAVLRGRPHEALVHYTKALECLLELGARWNMAECLEGMAGAFVALGGARTAARLYGAATSLRAALGTPPLPANMPGHVSLQTALIGVLGTPAYEEAFAAGQALSPEAAVAESRAASREPGAGRPDK